MMKSTEMKIAAVILLLLLLRSGSASDGWSVFKSNQYYISNKDPVPMKVARSFCKDRHADLVVINDEEEREFLHQQIKTQERFFYIGMSIDVDNSLSWMNGSPLVFQAWAQNQPAMSYGEEHCVMMGWNKGLWYSIHCAERLKFICKRSGSVMVNATVVPTEPPSGGCAPDWVRFQEKCFKIGLDLKTWTEARSYCRGLGGDLASVAFELQQAFLTLMMDDSTPDLWLGFSNLANTGGFRWTDGSLIHYTAWANDRYKENTCVALGSIQNPELGAWLKKNCSDRSGYVCSRALDPSIVPSPTEVPQTFKHRNSSYTLVQIRLTWKEAQHHCETSGAKLASIRDTLTQSYIAVQSKRLGQRFWIGLNSMETHGYFLWIDNWMLNLAKWASYEPNIDHPCVYVDVDGLWKTAVCNQTYYSVCKTSTDIVPTPPTQYPGVCPEQTNDHPKMVWLPFRGHCYSFAYGRESWYTASRMCMTRGAQLVSIVDPVEGRFIENYVKTFRNGHSYFWIGLFQSHSGHWLWQDNNVVSYVNWDEMAEEFKDYNYDDPESELEKCAVISSSSKQWEERRCRYNHLPFICKKAKVIKSTTVVTPTAAVDVHRSFSGVSVVVVIVALTVLAGLVYGGLRSSKKQSLVSENPLQHSTAALLPVD